jgi:hypothetical protein
MGAISIPERTGLSADLAVVLQSRQEQFAVLVASGLSYREAARRVGYNPDNSWRLMQSRAIRERVEELVREPDERVKAGIELELVMLRNRVADGDLTDAERSDIELRLKLALAHAKLRGWIVERKQVASAKLDFGKISRADFDAMLEQQLPALDPATRDRIKRIAAGHDDATNSEAENAAS